MRDVFACMEEWMVWKEMNVWNYYTNLMGGERVNK